MQIKVVDRIIIGNNTHFSFANEGLIEEYELDVLGLRIKGTTEAKRRRYRASSSDNQAESRRLLPG